MNTINIDLSKAAEQHFSLLLEKEKEESLNLRIFVSYPNTPSSTVGITCCPNGEEKTSDFSITYKNFILFIDKDSASSLKDASIDYQAEEMKEELIIKAPNLKKHPALVMPKELNIEEQLQHVIDHEINPMLANHGGRVNLLGIDSGIVKVQFSGGCQGCSMANVTVKDRIETILKERFPEKIIGIEDLTLHKEGAKPYY